MYDATPTPVEKVLTINPTWRCPVKCSYCHITQKASLDDKTTLDISTLSRVLKQSHALDFNEVRFSGGDPLVLGDYLFDLARCVIAETGKKPSLLTSGFSLNNRWARKATGLFSNIYVSVENPIEPIQSVVNNKSLLAFIRDNTCEDFPLKYGLTLIEENSFPDILEIFDFLFDNVDGKFYPQLDYPCLKGFAKPRPDSLRNIEVGTAQVFRKYGLVPFYFINIIGSPYFLRHSTQRVVVNIHPNGDCDIYDSVSDALEYSLLLAEQALTAQARSTECQKCAWTDACKLHEGGRLHFDWCDLRRAIWTGISTGLQTHDSTTTGRAFVNFVRGDSILATRLDDIVETTGMSTGSG